MADGIGVKVNIQDFKKQMSDFTLEMERRVFRAGANAAGQVYKKLMIEKAPILRRADKRRIAGTLRRAIYVARSRAGSRKGQETYSVSFRKGKRFQKQGKDAFYGAFLEAGWIPRGPGRRIRGGTRRRQLERKRLSAQKITQYAFIDPTFKAAGTQPLRAFSERVEKRVAAENAKRRSR